MSILKFGPNGLRYSDSNYISTFIKGKTNVIEPSKFRFILSNKNNERYILYWEPDLYGMGTLAIPALPNFGNQMQIILPGHFRVIDKNHYKMSYYNYYHYSNDPQTLHDMLDAFVKSDPFLSTDYNVYEHQSLSNLKKTNQYKWCYEFDGKKY